MYKKYNDGLIEVICGCMFAGKTEELIRRIEVFKFAKKKVVVFKPKIDNRYSEDKVVSHAGSSVTSYVIQDAKEIFQYIDDDVDVIAVDEVQFFDEDIVVICEYFAQKGKRIMLAGLDMDFRGVPFPVMAQLITIAEFVTKLTAVCTMCGSPATRTQRLVNGNPADYNDPIILVGSQESYEARCRHDHIVPGNKNATIITKLKGE